MSDPSSLRRFADGRRLDPQSIDATGATLGDYLGAVDDGSGGQRAGYLPLPVTPGDVDPGVGTGTPGNWSHNFVPVDDAGSFVLGAHDDDPEPLGVAKLLKFLLPGAVLRGQATVLVKGAVTAYLDFRVSLDRGATWETDLLGVRVPLRDADDEITANGFTQAIGLAIEVPAEFEGEVLLDPVVVGGNGTDVPEIQSFVLESTSEAPPPATGEDEPVTPEIPTDGLFAYWALTEGSGQTVANKSPGVGTADLVLGATTGANTEDPTWATGPRRLVTSSIFGGSHHYCNYSGVPSVAAGSAVFFAANVTSLGTSPKHLCAIIDGAVLNLNIGVDYPSRLPFARVTENSGGGGGTFRTASGTTVINNNTWHLFGLVHDAAANTLKIYIDPDDGLPEATVACSTALTGGSTPVFVLGAGGVPITGNQGPDNADFGDVELHVGSAVSGLTASKIAAMCLQFKTIYTALP